MIIKLLQALLGLSERATRLLVELAGRYRKYMVISFTASLVSALMEGGTLALLALALEMLGSGDPSRLGRVALSIGDGIGLDRDGVFIMLVAAAVLTQVLHSALHFVSDVAHATVQAGVEQTARMRIFEQFMAVSYAEARKRRVGDLSSYMDQVNFLGLALQRMHSIVQELLLLAVYFGLLVWLSWQATLVSMVAMVGLSLVVRRLIRRVRSAANDFKGSLTDVSQQTIEYLNGLRVVRSFGREQFARDRLDAASAACGRARKVGLVWQGAIAPVIQAVSVCVVGGVLVIGFALYGSSNRSTLIDLASFLLVIFRSAPRLSMLNKNWGQLAHNSAFFERAAEILRTDDKDYGAGGTKPFAGLRDRIALQHVSLTYPGTDTPAVHDLTFELPRGQMVALVGESGAGKTTIADLLLGLYPVTAGDILVDGTPLRELSWDDWRRHIGVVSQDTFLFSGTIRTNIAFGRLDATDAEIEAAARAAHAHEFIVQLDAGYDTIIGEQGYRLSGGQRQRLAIARAVLRDPQILILDEATSDLDSQSEALIQESLLRLRSNRTVLVIAHRLSTIAAADEILVMRSGRITERGRHADLLSNGGTYAHFVNLQGAPARTVQ